MTIEDLERAYDRLGFTCRRAARSMREWGDLMSAEKVRFAIEAEVATWTPAERASFERRVRELHAAEPDEGLGFCMIRVGAAMEACRG